MVRITPCLAAKIGKGLATPAAPSTTTHGKAKDFFREVCRILPWTVNNYKLDELITVPELRRNVAQQFQRHSHVTSPQVVDILIYKGREELEMVALQHKQRHHLVNDYISVPTQQKQEAVRAAAISPFMDRFYQNLYWEDWSNHCTGAADKPSRVTLPTWDPQHYLPMKKSKSFS